MFKLINIFVFLTINAIPVIFPERCNSQQDSSDIYFHDSILSINQELLQSAFDGDELNLVYAIKNGANINFINEDGITALMFASQNGFADIVSILIHNGSKVDMIPGNGVTALMAAAEYGYNDICSILISNGADINMCDKYGKSPLMYATAFGYAGIDSFLIRNGASVSLKSKDSLNALMLAAYSGYTKICNLLIENGAEINSRDKNGFTPLMYAAGNGFPDIVKLLLDKGADINYKNSYGTNTVMLAVEGGYVDITDSLIKRGSNKSAVNLRSENIYKISLLTGNKKVTRLLHKKGIRYNLLPIYNKIFLGYGAYFNTKDLLFSGIAGVEDIRYNTLLFAGFDARYWGNRVLIQKSDSLFYQLWEKRYGITTGAVKKFTLKHLNNNKYGIFAGVKGIYTFGGYRGSDEKIKNEIIFVPCAGIYLEGRNFGLMLDYEYSDFGIRNESPYKINLTMEYSFFYKKYHYQYKNIQWL